MKEITINNLENNHNIKCLNSLHLKLIACTFMLIDHIWLAFCSGDNFVWMNCIGRLAFPIFAFQVVEGFFHTKSFKKYLKRMFIFALISEIPFNLINSGSLIYLEHQNVMFTFCIALICMYILEKVKKQGKFVYFLLFITVLVNSFLIGTFTFVDYGGYGIWVVLLFYFTKNIRFNKIIELIGMIIINYYMIGGESFIIKVLGKTIFFPEQAFAVLSLIFIWLYNGKRGVKNKKVQNLFYLFYPIHLLIIGVIALIF